MNKIEALREYVRVTHPSATTNLTKPVHRDGIWSLDVDLANQQLAIQWSSKSGFGISTVGHENFGEGPDEVLPTLEQAKRRVDQLLKSSDCTAPAIGLAISRLRERRGLTQTELAEKLGLRQATISGIERRGDVQLSTLRRVVEALGGTLEVYASFPDRRYSLELPPAQSFAICASERKEPDTYDASPCGARDPDGIFEGLRDAGRLPEAFQIAQFIRARGSVLEMP